MWGGTLSNRASPRLENALVRVGPTIALWHKNKPRWYDARFPAEAGVDEHRSAVLLEGQINGER